MLKKQYSVVSPLILINFLTLIISIFSLTTYAWHETGHLITSNIAARYMDKKIFDKLDTLIAEHSRYYPKANTFITSCVWPDDIKVNGVNFYSKWHNQDAYFSIDETPLPKVYNRDKAFAMISKNIKLLISEDTTPSEKAFSLKFVIHLIGDMHQPMHSISRVSSKYKWGDMGGNFFKINHPEYKNLHSLWDSGLMTLPRVERPFTTESKQFLDSLTDNIVALYPRSSFSHEYLNAKYDVWQEENIEIVKNNVYPNIEFDGVPSQEYLETNRPIIQRQLALAGYRIANTLNCLYESDKCIK